MQSGDDPLWQLPLHEPYRELLNSKVADISNISSGSYGGAITAALFLQEFVKPEIPWIHIDVMAWNIRSLPGRPEGGEAMGIRSVFELIRQRFEGEVGV
jgi:leucyl aminopeptidase